MQGQSKQPNTKLLYDVTVTVCPAVPYCEMWNRIRRRCLYSLTEVKLSSLLGTTTSNKSFAQVFRVAPVILLARFTCNMKALSVQRTTCYPKGTRFNTKAKGAACVGVDILKANDTTFKNTAWAYISMAQPVDGRLRRDSSGGFDATLTMLLRQKPGNIPEIGLVL